MFLLSILILTDHLKGKPRHRSYRTPWKLVKKFWRRRLHLSLFHRCRHRIGQRSCCINGSNFPSPCCTKHRRWRKRKTKAKARHKRRRTVHHEFFLAQPKCIKPHLILKGRITSAALDSFCDGSQNVLSLPKLMSKLKRYGSCQKCEEVMPTSSNSQRSFLGEQILQCLQNQGSQEYDFDLGYRGIFWTHSISK